MGRSLRTNRYHLVEWRVPTTNFTEYELYDHNTDPDENINLAAQPAYKSTVQTLARQLNMAWKTDRRR